MLERFESPDGLIGYRSPELAALGVPHAFTTRVARDGSELDVGPVRDDLAHQLRRLAGAPEAARPVDLRQVHGATVWEAGEELPAAEVEADASVTERPDRLLLVRTADCVAILLARDDGRRVGAIHAGWRGLAAGVIPSALRVLGAGAWTAAIGPCISRAHFEVGPEVVAAFEAAGLEQAIHPDPGSRAHVDLRAAAAIQLERGGVRRIDGTDRCTYEHSAELFSFRRDVTHGGGVRTGRLAGLVAPVP